MTLTTEHKAKMAAGRERKRVSDREDSALRAAEFCEWSRNYSKGKATLRDCPFDPQRSSDADFDNARSMGLI